MTVLALSAMCSMGLNGKPVIAGAQDPGVYKKCHFHDSACTVTMSGRTVTLDIKPKPVRAMRTLTFSLEVSGESLVSPPCIDLDMPAMHMGPNRVMMKPVGPGLYKGEGFIVKCPSGIRVWCARVTLPGVGIADFVFHVLY